MEREANVLTNGREDDSTLLLYNRHISRFKHRALCLQDVFSLGFKTLD